MGTAIAERQRAERHHIEKSYPSTLHSEKQRGEGYATGSGLFANVCISRVRKDVMKELDITQAKARTLVKKICKDFDIPECKIWFIPINDPETIGWYSSKSPNMYAYIMIEKCWSKRLVLTLHELTHHIQAELYTKEEEEEDTAHGKTFTQAKNRIATWARNNINDHWDWESLLTRFAEGRRKCKKKMVAKK